MAEEKDNKQNENDEANPHSMTKDLKEIWNDPEQLAEQAYQIWWRWADFHIEIVEPEIEPISPPLMIKPELIPNTQDYEFVYNIEDHGYKLSTSKGEDMYKTGMSMCKLYYTIEKMIALLVERLETAGIDMEQEVQVALMGHELAKRKGFESIINLPYNVVINNFDPEAWGDRYLQNVQRVSDKGYGYPSETPRDTYKQSHETSPATAKR